MSSKQLHISLPLGAALPLVLAAAMGCGARPHDGDTGSGGASSSSSTSGVGGGPSPNCTPESSRRSARAALKVNPTAKGFALPNVNAENDPQRNLPWDFVELTSSQDLMVGYTEVASPTFKTLAMGDLGGGEPTRIVAPPVSEAFQKQVNHYWDAYVDEIWDFYSKHELKFCVNYEHGKHWGDRYAGKVQGEKTVFYRLALADQQPRDCSLAAPCEMPKPTTKEIFANGGVLNLPGENHADNNQFGAALAAAMNRHVATEL